MPEASLPPRALLPLKPADFMVLAVLQDSPSHGYALSQAIAQRSDGHVRVRPGDLYRVLYRLSEQGLIVADEPEGPSERRRTVYQLTDLGAETVQAEASRLVQLGTEVLRGARSNRASVLGAGEATELS